SAAVREKAFLGGFSWDKLIELFSQRDVRLIGSNAEAGVQVSLELPLNAFHHRRGTMTYVGASDAAGEIDEAVSVYIFDDGTFSARGEDRRGMEDTARDGLLTPLHQRLRARARDRGFDLDGSHCVPSVPADRLLVQVDVHLLGLEILFKSPRTQLAAKA